MKDIHVYTDFFHSTQHQNMTWALLIQVIVTMGHDGVGLSAKSLMTSPESVGRKS